MLGGERVTYQQVWDRSARVAGGLRGRRGRARRPGRQPLRQQPRVVPRVLGHADGRRRRGAGEHALLRQPRSTTSSPTRARSYVFQPDAALPDGDPFVIDGVEPDRPGRDLLHQRHDGLPEGCDDHPRELPVEQRDVPADHATARGHAPAQPGVGPAVPRHRLQQPADHHHAAGRHDGHHAGVRGAGVPAGDGRRAASTSSRRCRRSSGWR